MRRGLRRTTTTRTTGVARRDSSSRTVDRASYPRNVGQICYSVDNGRFGPRRWPQSRPKPGSAHLTLPRVIPTMVSTVTPPPPKSIFVTVGSTKFDALIERILQEDTLKTIRDAGFSRLVVQCGDSVLSLDWTLSGTTLERNVEGLSVELWRFEPSIDARMASADVIISHAGEPKRVSYHVLARTI